jgi:O-antigen ligase
MDGSATLATDTRPHSPSPGSDTSTPATGRGSLYLSIGIFVLIVADLPGLSYSVWAPKMAVLLMLGAAGLPILVLRARTGRRSPIGPPAIAALVFVAVAVAATAVSPAVLSAVVGLYNQGTGLVFVVALAGVWALGTVIDDAGRPVLEVAIVAGAAVNAIVAMLQMAGAMPGAIPTQGTHASGLLGNPVFLGAVCVAALALLGGRFVDDPHKWVAPVVLVAVGIGASSERLPALMMLGVLMAELVVAVYRQHGEPVRLARRAWFCGVTVMAWLIGSILWPLGHGKGLLGAFTSGGGAGAVGYTAQSTAQSTFGDRIGIWKVAATAVGHRPILGYGPGQFRDATSGLMPLSLVRSIGATLFSDAHNLFIEYATTTGLLGLGSLVVWLVLAARHRRGRLLLAAALLLLTGLAEPQNVVMTPLMFLALGAASLGAPVSGRRLWTIRGTLDGRVTQEPRGATSGPAVPGGRAGRVAVLGCAVAAAVAGLALVVGDVQYARASNLSSIGSQTAAIRVATSADQELFMWPRVPELMAKAELARHFGITPAAGAVAATYAREAVRRDPTDAGPWFWLANIQFDAGDVAGARRSALAGLRLRPLDTSFLNIMGLTDRLQGDRVGAHYWLERSLAVDPHQKTIRDLATLGCVPGSALVPPNERC